MAEPTYVAEFLLGRYCASVDEEEIREGLQIVERQLGEKTVRAGEHELFKARAKDKGHVKLIDLVTARLDAATDSFLATLPSLQLKDVRISPELVHANERMLTGGFYAEVELTYDPTIAQERNGIGHLGWSLYVRSKSPSEKCCQHSIEAGSCSLWMNGSSF
jgi:ATP-dependent Lon protease